MLLAFLDLVDRYWNGSKSLHNNDKFMSNTFVFFLKILRIKQINKI